MKHTGRPDVSLQNQERVYEYYGKREPNPKIAHFLHRLFGIVYHPHIGFEEGAKTAVAEHFAGDGRLIIAANHVSASDPLVLASLVQREPVLHPLMTKVYILGQAPLFRQRIIRPFIDGFGAIPTFRGKDVRNSGLPEVEAQTLGQSATRAMLDICIKRADEGYNLAIFPTGTRKGGNIRSGLGQIACGINDPERFRLLPIGIDYSHTSALGPNVFVGIPQALPDTIPAVTALTETVLQECVAQAQAA